LYTLRQGREQNALLRGNRKKADSKGGYSFGWPAGLIPAVLKYIEKYKIYSVYSQIANFVAKIFVQQVYLIISFYSQCA